MSSTRVQATSDLLWIKVALGHEVFNTLCQQHLCIAKDHFCTVVRIFANYPPVIEHK